MNAAKWIALLFICFALQTTVVPAIAVSGVKPDLVLIVLFFLALKTGQTSATWAGFFVGLAQDLFAPSILGQNALAKCITGFAAGFFNVRVMRLDIVFRMLLLVIVFIINDALYFAVQFMKGGSGHLPYELVTITLPRALYSLLFALIPYVKDRFLPAQLRR